MPWLKRAVSRLSEENNIMSSPGKSFTPPHSLEGEKAVLGAILREPESLNTVADKLVPDFFYLDAHRQIFTAMLELYQANEPTDILTVADKLRRLGAASEYLGPQYLVELTESSPVAQNIEYYAGIVREHHYLRKIIISCQDTIQKAMTFDGTVNDFVGDVEKQFLEITNSNDLTGIVTISAALDDALKDLEKRINTGDQMTGVPSQFVDIDRITGGWQRSDLVIIAARPGMGKTAFALNNAVNAARAGKGVTFFSLEMSKSQLLFRIMASEARIDASKFRRGDFTDEELDRLMHASKGIHNLNFGVDDTPGLSILELRSRCRRYKKERGLDMIVVDYLQLMTGSGTKKYESREREIAEISMGLKSLAKELDIAVIALAQLNRGPDSRPDKVPKISDLRESGSMEQDADMILFLYRDEYYNPNSEDAGKALVKIGKNRHGALEDISLAFAPNFMKFTNLQYT